VSAGDYQPGEDAWEISVERSGTQMTFWYQKGKGDDNNIYGKMEIRWPDSIRIKDENEVRFCLEWGKED